MTTQDQEIICKIRGAAGVVVLNRPKALNALSLGMVRELARTLHAWEYEHLAPLPALCISVFRYFSSTQPKHSFLFFNPPISTCNLIPRPVRLRSNGAKHAPPALRKRIATMRSRPANPALPHCLRRQHMDQPIRYPVAGEKLLRPRFYSSYASSIAAS